MVSMFSTSRLNCLFVCSALLASMVGAQDPDGYSRLMQGPMLGAVTPSSFRVWVRASWEWPLQIVYATDPEFSDARTTESVMAIRSRDYCATLEVDGLRPSTTYYYRVVVAEAEDRYLGGRPAFRVKTAPPEGEATSFRIAFGSCARWQSDPIQPIWRVIGEYEPDLFFWLGDNVYADTLDPEIIEEEFRRQRELPVIRRFLATVPQLAIWDDHDFGLNNHDRNNPIKEEALAVWKAHWPNPSYGLPDTPGVFFKYGYGGVDFFFLDTRYYRDPNEDRDGPGKTMLGQEQLQWLKEELKGSEAPFKVLLSGSLWSEGKGPGGDAWSSFLHERDALFDWIAEQQVAGVVLLAGDPHTAELNVMSWSGKGGYDLYELVSSPLAQEPGKSWLFRPVEHRLRIPYNQGPNFGVIDFAMDRADPTLTFNIVGLEGRGVWRPLVLRASELRAGVVSWTGKQGAEARRWTEQFNSGWSDRN